MKIHHLAFTALATTSVVLAQSVTSSAQAAALGGSGTCADVSFSYLSCAGAFSGNDKGAKGTGLENLETFFGAGWSFAGDDESGLVSFDAGGDGTTTGTASTTLSGFGAIALKAGKSYSLYTIADLANFDWSTEGVTPVGRGNTPGLSHLSVYRRANPIEPEAPQEIPEPGMLLGMVGIAGVGSRLKRQLGDR